MVDSGASRCLDWLQRLNQLLHTDIIHRHLHIINIPLHSHIHTYLAVTFTLIRINYTKAYSSIHQQLSKSLYQSSHCIHTATYRYTLLQPTLTHTHHTHTTHPRKLLCLFCLYHAPASISWSSLITSHPIASLIHYTDISIIENYCSRLIGYASFIVVTYIL